MQNLEISLNREYILAGDISISMQTVDPKCANLSRYDYMLEKFKAFIRTTSDFDQHGGCTIMLFGRDVHKYEHANLSMIEDKLKNVKFEPLTMTNKLIAEAYEEHREEKRKELKENKIHPGTTLMIFTDGDPSDKMAVQREIMSIAQAIDLPLEFQIVFLTVGTIEKSLQSYLDLLVKLPVKNQIVSVYELENIEFIAAVSGV